MFPEFFLNLILDFLFICTPERRKQKIFRPVSGNPVDDHFLRHLSAPRVGLQHPPQGGDGAGVAVGDDGVLALELVHGAAQHLVGHGAGKADQKIRRTQLILQAADGFREHLGLTLVLLAKLLVLSDHTFVSA